MGRGGDLYRAEEDEEGLLPQRPTRDTRGQQRSRTRTQILHKVCDYHWHHVTKGFCDRHLTSHLIPRPLGNGRLTSGTLVW